MKPDTSPEALLRASDFLLVEDFEAMRSVLKGQLLRCGAHRVDTAKDGREATAMLAAKSYGVVMCDYNLAPARTVSSCWRKPGSRAGWGRRRCG